MRNVAGSNTHVQYTLEIKQVHLEPDKKKISQIYTKTLLSSWRSQYANLENFVRDISISKLSFTFLYFLPLLHSKKASYFFSELEALKVKYVLTILRISYRFSNQRLLVELRFYTFHSKKVITARYSNF